MLSIDFRADLSGMQRALFALRADEVPFASALALTSLARGVADLEREEVKETFENPTPFTQNAWRVTAATKRMPIAYVRAKDIQAQYLEPYVDGGDRWLGKKRAMLAPRQATLNQYGNLPRNALKRYQGRKDVFVGKIKFKKSGEIVSGVWQRGVGAGKGLEVKRGKRSKGGGEYGTKGNNQSLIGGVRTTLKLLVQFEGTSEAPKHLEFYETARAYVRANAKREFDAAFRKALATKKR
ncbi:MULTISPECIES: hypothetical protein [unclassified Novosphingobium]|uniref:hypothetical protein n=1 Tax=unclassified Novosphingobium TaxID=2644732 RepID=UPI00086A24C0|nr:MULTISPECIES: hypothetical protein [unclassified Novosphingobium]MBN9143742.1 hypothetical protein [Novosphingobium sp.]ODU84352.1 MAG: hypothetical protein ABT10_02925 [Novosphingobium sp. SCN 63-17]OJX92892.1 MAG: hypothetical protein BGP00_23525 [Novosphingobium sp. 63-713]